LTEEESLCLIIESEDIEKILYFPESNQINQRGQPLEPELYLCLSLF